MSTRAHPACPACGSTDCRRSRWRSHEEHAGHPGLHPWRCLACDQRFLAPDDALRPRSRWPLVVGILSALLLLGIGIASVRMLDLDEPGDAPGEQHRAPGNEVGC
ncbi:MAG TPA: sel1 repeat family protein, partial [Thauera aminoaromatica]|nr:sel1 repeat family protein [Thauera aminoaromatica]